MTKQIVRKTIAAAVAVALIAGSTLSAAEAKDGRRAAAVIGALAAIAGALVEASAEQSDGDYRPVRHGRFEGRGFHGKGFHGKGFHGQRFEGHGFRNAGFGYGTFEKGGFKKIGFDKHGPGKNGSSKNFKGRF